MSDIKKLPLNIEAPEEFEAPPRYSLEAKLSPTEESVGLLDESRFQQTIRTKCQTTSPMSLNPLDLPVDANGERSFSHPLVSLHDCDVPTFCFSLWCTPCQYGKNKSRLDWLNATRGREAHPSHGRPIGTDCGFWCLLNMFGGNVATATLQCFVRRSVRERYSIRGNVCTDMGAAFCCLPCQLTQESRELDEEEARLAEGGVRLRDDEVV